MNIYPRVLEFICLIFHKTQRSPKLIRDPLIIGAFPIIYLFLLNFQWTSLANCL